jgi:ribosomal-protein-alanine N-acetyltransferase
MKLPPEALVSDRLVLRRPMLADAPAIYEYSRDPEVTRYLSFRTHTSVADAEHFLASCHSRWESGGEYCWLMTLRGQDRTIGSIACRVRGHMVDIGYAVARAHWRQGYATEAGRAVMAWTAELPDVRRVWAVCDCANTASARVLEKLGMAREGVLRRWIIHPNISPEPRDCYVYAKVRGDGESR